ncbi:MAG: HEAT repeat domain-containing protein, partial [Planctomycetota bacterium]
EPEVTDPDAGLSPDDIELRDGLVELVLAQPRMLAASLGDVEAGGDGLVAALAAGLDNPARPDEELRALVDLTSGLEDARVARSLLGVATRARSSELRGFAATALQRHLEAPDADAVLPALVKRLKYERDADVKGWIERSVQRIDAGVTASERPSDALRGELWRMVQALSGAHFQLRGVDDARFVLARLGPWAAAELALALEDDDVYVRLHSAQVLQRMAERAEPAVASLIAALYDRNDGVAGTAAEALSVVAPERAQGELLARLDDAPPYEVRVALVRALAQLPGGGPTDRLTAVFADAPGTDLRLAAARGLLAAGAEDTVLPWLVEQLARTRGGDPAGAEAHLDEWLRAGAGPEGLLERWVALGPRGEVVHSGDQVRARRAARAALFAE